MSGRSVVLSRHAARVIDELVASGSYADEAEVLQAGLDALRDRSTALEAWLRDEVIPVYDAMQADPGRGISVEDVSRSLDEIYERRVRVGGR
jgi:antitoxin ParD1/3/4